MLRLVVAMPEAAALALWEAKAEYAEEEEVEAEAEATVSGT